MNISLDQLKLFPEYRNIKSLEKPDSRAVTFRTEVDPIVKLIYAPDPETGLPRSDVGLAYSSSISDELSQFIRTSLQQPLPDLGSAGDDPEMALAAVRSRQESIDSYFTRLRDMCNASFNSK